MIEIIIQDEMPSILNKEIIIKKFAKVLNETGYSVNRYVLTEYFDNEKPCGYKIHFTQNKK